jgi:hypothetical protein
LLPFPNTTSNGGGLGPQFATFALSLNRRCRLTARIDGINRAFLFRNARRAGSAQTHPHEQRSTNSRSSSAARIPITDRRALDRQRSSLPPPMSSWGGGQPALPGGPVEMGAIVVCHTHLYPAMSSWGGRLTSTCWGTCRDGWHRRLPHSPLPHHEFMGGLANQHLLEHFSLCE